MRRLVTLWAADLRRPAPSPHTVPAELQVSELTAGTAPLLRSAMGREAERVDLRLSRGCRAFVGLVGDEVAAYSWLSTGPEWIGELGLELRPGPAEAYVWNCMTLPGHRRRGYFRSVLGCVVLTARAEGVERLWIGGTEPGVEPSVVDAGFVPALRLQAWTIGGLRRLTVSPPATADYDLRAAAWSALGQPAGALDRSLRRARRRVH